MRSGLHRGGRFPPETKIRQSRFQFDTQGQITLSRGYCLNSGLSV